MMSPRRIVYGIIPTNQQSQEDQSPPGSGITMRHLRKRSANDTPMEQEEVVVEAPPMAKKTKTWLEMLECPICLELPRCGPVHNCINGHLFCQSCLSKITKCPVCRSPEIHCRNLIAEQVIQVTLKSVPINCRFKECNINALLKDLGEHEKVCTYREVACPSSHRGACEWRGPYKSLLLHIRDKKCVQVVRKSNDESEITDIFTSSLGDFPATASSVFDRPNVVTHWKPIVMLSRRSLPYWMYGLVQRKSCGLWTFMIRAMMSQDMCDQMDVKLTIQSGNDDKQKKTYTYNGCVVSNDMSNSDANALGRYLTLTDEQVRAFKKPNDLHLFQYRIEVTPPPQLKAMVDHHLSQDPEVCVVKQEESEQEDLIYN